MKKRPIIRIGDYVKIRDRRTGKLSEEIYRVYNVMIRSKDVRRTGGTRSSEEGYAEVHIKSAKRHRYIRNRRDLWRVPNTKGRYGRKKVAAIGMANYYALKPGDLPE